MLGVFKSSNKDRRYYTSANQQPSVKATVALTKYDPEEEFCRRHSLLVLFRSELCSGASVDSII